MSQTERSGKGKRWAAALSIATTIAAGAEGLRQWAYYDPVGVLTVCYGSTNNVKKGVKYPLQECRDRLTREMDEALSHVERCAPGLPEHQLAAFGDAVFNLGPRVVCDRRPPPDGSTAARMLAVGDVVGACNQLPRWNKGKVAGVLVPLPGLTARREKERKLCLTGTL